MNHASASNPPAGISAPPPVAAPPEEFLSGPDEARAFWRLRRRLAETLLRQTFSRSRFRLSLILALSILLWLGLFWMFAEGFWFIKGTILDPGTHDRTVRAVLGLFFAALTVMLVFSSGIILYGSLFRSPEIAFLLTIPARVQRVFLYKFQEAVLFSSWGFLLLGSPMLVAYGTVARAPWYYYAILVPMIVAFVYIPAAIGAILCLAVVRCVPGIRLRVLATAAAVLALVGAWIVWSVLSGPQSDLLTPAWFQEILQRLQFSEQRLLPSWWLSTGLLEASRNVWHQSVLFLALMISNALFFRQLAVWTAAGVYRSAYSELLGRNVRRKSAAVAWIDRAAFRCAALLPLPVRLLMVKDLRLFRRDPVQWSQFLIFFGLLGLYFANMRRFNYDVYYVGWVNMVSFLNLLVVGLLMSTFTTRFIFPMISLECRQFWLLGLLPVRRETILWSKFLFAAGGSMVPCSVLILTSDAMLRVTPLVLASHQLTCVILCVGLAGIAVGLGARLPNLREQSPPRIAAGFGGTLNLVVSTLYILAVVLMTAVPCHFYLATSHTYAAVAAARSAGVERWLELWLVAGTAASILLGVAATVVPLRVGFRAFRRLEF